MSMLQSCCCVNRKWILMEMCDCYDPDFFPDCTDQLPEWQFIKDSCNPAIPACANIQIGDIFRHVGPQFDTECCYTVIDIRIQISDPWPQYFLVNQINGPADSCDTEPCCEDEPQICCFEDGTCLMLLPDTCLGAGGTVGPPPPNDCTTYECPVCYRQAIPCPQDDPPYELFVLCDGIASGGLNIFDHTHTDGNSYCWFVDNTDEFGTFDRCDPGPTTVCLAGSEMEYADCGFCGEMVTCQDICATLPENFVVRARVSGYDAFVECNDPQDDCNVQPDFDSPYGVEARFSCPRGCKQRPPSPPFCEPSQGNVCPWLHQEGDPGLGNARFQAISDSQEGFCRIWIDTRDHAIGNINCEIACTTEYTRFQHSNVNIRGVYEWDPDIPEFRCGGSGFRNADIRDGGVVTVD